MAVAGSGGMKITPEADRHFLGLGVQYYVAGRCAALAGQLPICGNLFHHAVEMLLKARLSQTSTPKDLTQLGHSLPRVWTKFKEEFPTIELSRFESVIAELDPFERIRYPDNMIQEGVQMRLDWNRSHVLSPATFGRGHIATPVYRVVVNDIDGLVAEIFKICSRDPRAFIHFTKRYGADAVRQDNPVADFLLGPSGTSGGS